MKRWCMLLAAICLLLASDAWAQTEAELNAARALADAGLTLFEQGNYARAIERFQGAERIVHASPHVLFIARCHSKLGALAAAQKAYASIVSETLPDDAPTALLNARREAQQELAAVEGRVPSITVTVVGPADAQLQIDGQAVTAGEKHALDPGNHEVAASASGYEPQTRSVSLAEGQHEPITLTLSASSQGGEQPPIDDDGEGPSVALPIAVLGVGVVGVIVGAITGGMALGKSDELHAACPDRTRCAPDNQALEDDARTLGTVSTVSFVVGGVLAAAGATWLIVTLASDDDEPEASAFNLRIGLTPGFEATF